MPDRGRTIIELATPDALAAHELAFGILREDGEQGDIKSVYIRNDEVPRAVSGLAADDDGVARRAHSGRVEMVVAPSAGDYLLGTVAAGILTLDQRTAYAPVTGLDESDQRKVDALPEPDPAA